MVCSNCSDSGVIFSIDTESRFDKVVLINSAWGLGENIVQGAVTPNEYQVFKPLLRDRKCVPIINKKCGDKLIKSLW